MTEIDRATLAHVTGGEGFNWQGILQGALQGAQQGGWKGALQGGLQGLLSAFGGAGGAPQAGGASAAQ